MPPLLSCGIPSLLFTIHLINMGSNRPLLRLSSPKVLKRLKWLIHWASLPRLLLSLLKAWLVKIANNIIVSQGQRLHLPLASQSTKQRWIKKKIKYKTKYTLYFVLSLHFFGQQIQSSIGMYRRKYPRRKKASIGARSVVLDLVFLESVYRQRRRRLQRLLPPVYAGASSSWYGESGGLALCSCLASQLGHLQPLFTSAFDWFGSEVVVPCDFFGLLYFILFCQFLYFETDSVPSPLIVLFCLYINRVYFLVKIFWSI